MARCLPCRIIIITGGRAIGNLTALQSLMAGREDLPSAESEPFMECLNELNERAEALIEAITNEETSELPGG